MLGRLWNRFYEWVAQPEASAGTFLFFVLTFVIWTFARSASSLRFP